MKFLDEEIEGITPEIRVLILRMMEAQLEVLKAIYVSKPQEEQPR